MIVACAAIIGGCGSTARPTLGPSPGASRPAATTRAGAHRQTPTAPPAATATISSARREVKIFYADLNTGNPALCGMMSPRLLASVGGPAKCKTSIQALKGSGGPTPSVTSVSGDEATFSNGTTATFVTGRWRFNGNQGSSPPAESGGPTIGACFVLPDGHADAEVTFPTTKPPMQVQVAFEDTTAGVSLTPGFAPNEDGRYAAALGGSLSNSKDKITCQIQQVTNLEHGGSTVASQPQPVVNQGPIPSNYGTGNGNTPW